jgi:hypothetical protein
MRVLSVTMTITTITTTITATTLRPVFIVGITSTFV